MSYRFCLDCFLPVFRIVSDLPPEYCCLNADCSSFKASVPESSTAAELFDDIIGETDPLSFTLEDDFLPFFPDQAWETQPLPQQLTEQASCSFPQSAPPLEQFTQQLTEQASWSFPQPAPPLEEFTQQDHSMLQAAPALTLNGVELISLGSMTVETRKGLIVPVLEKPFSELVLEGLDPLAEITEFVNRSVAQRRMEAEKTGKVKRYSNSWLLYCRAYIKLAKTVLNYYNTEGKYDFTVTTSFVAQSWAIESKSVRKQFNTLLGINRRLQREAFPGTF